MSRDRRGVMVAGIVLVVLFYLVLAYGIYGVLTSKVIGANDFYSRWAGARAFLLRGENPYSDAVTREIQMGMYGRLARPDEDQVAFAYPLYTAFAIAPLVPLGYPQAQALWMAVLIFGIAGGTLALALQNRIALRPVVLAVLLLSVLVFYPSVRGIFLGQFALFSFLWLALALGAIQGQRDVLAGVFLALATVKPQPAIFLVPTVLVWGMVQRRLKLVTSAVGTLLVLVVIALIWLPTWPLDFWQGIRKYADYEPVGPPIQTLSQSFFPGSPGMTITLGVSLVLIGWMVWRIVRSLDAGWKDFQSAIGLVAIVTTLTAGRVGTPDQVLLLIPWVNWLGAWLARGRRLYAVLAVLVLLILPWTVFLTTLRGDAEHVGVTLVLPLLSLAVYLWQELGARRPVVRTEP